MLWGITSFFNPSGYQSRLHTYRTFKANLKIPLAVVELSFDGRFELRPDDADIVLQLAGADVLWQKERLLNLALKALPRECDVVAWLDADVIFENDDWPERANAALEQIAVVQLFGERCNLARNATRIGTKWAPLELSATGVGKAIATRTIKSGILKVAGSYVIGGPTNGLAWAARRSLLDRYGLYDAHILGQGDRAIVCAAIGAFEDLVAAGAANHRQEKHYRSWAEPFFADVAGSIGFIEGRIFHLWHGDTKGRTLRTADYVDFAKFGFDPYTDIALAPNGCWRWNSAKPEMHRYVETFFAARKEDG